jgi:hypothetical protein
MEETIHVFVDSEGALHASHTFAFWRARFLDLRRVDLAKNTQSRNDGPLARRA